ncbi:O-antigen ligase family protein [Devosia psychrophila]|uniref:O-antigen ligase family protein n=1 Tax=Devosia psychrophila TaxID=728005 RepID=UPI0031F4E006
MAWPFGFARMMTLPQVVIDLFTEGHIEEASGNVRQLMYGASWQAFQHAPFFGYGWGQLMPSIAPYLPNGLDTFELVHHHLHSDTLDMGVSAGAAGLVAYGMVIAAPVVGCLTSPRDSQFRARLIGTICLSTAYLVFGATYLSFGYEYHTTLYVCLAAILIGFCRDDNVTAKGQPS